MLKISLDLDGVLCDWYSSYLERYGEPTSDMEITKNVYKSRLDKDFWLNLQVLNMPEFKVHQYTTARIIKKRWIKEYLSKNGFPSAPIYQVLGYGLSKAHHIKAGGCDVHIDDSLSVFKDLNLKGVPCLLLDTPSNREWGPVGRIYSLNEREIEDAYHLFLSTIFPHFKDFLNGTIR